MRALRRWVRKARCRAKYGPACPHGGHYGGKRRNSLTAAHTHLRKRPDEETHRPADPGSQDQSPTNRSTDRTSAEA